MTEDAFIFLFSCISLGILIPVGLTFKQDINNVWKIASFIVLPIIEIFLSQEAIRKATYFKIDASDFWQLYLLIFSIIFGLSFTLIIALLPEINRTIRLIIKFLALASFGMTFLFSAVFLD